MLAGRRLHGVHPFGYQDNQKEEDPAIALQRRLRRR
jgi:hypothetical protein